MQVRIAANNNPEEVMMRDVYCQTLIDLAKKNDRIVVLDADLMKSMGMIPFLDAFPERTFNCGVQEANMIGVASGLSATGKVPFAHSFGAFATRRCFDQIYLSAAYARLNVRIVGSDPGITAAYNGGTHMSFEDMGIMRLVPGARVIEPVDSVMLADIVRQVADIYGISYVRLLRRNAVRVYEPGSTFEIGRAVTLRDGTDLTIIASGIMVSEALEAADLLSAKSISARIVNIFTLKPIDESAIISCAEETGAIVTAENHNVVGGLGSAVAEVLAGNYCVPLEKAGIQDCYGQVGSLDSLKDVFGLTSAHLVAKAIQVLERKPGSS